jgi:hypothetical protein
MHDDAEAFQRRHQPIERRPAPRGAEREVEDCGETPTEKDAGRSPDGLEVPQAHSRDDDRDGTEPSHSPCRSSDERRRSCRHGHHDGRPNRRVPTCGPLGMEQTERRASDGAAQQPSEDSGDDAGDEELQGE